MKTVVIPNDVAIPDIVNDALYQQYVVLLNKNVKDAFLSGQSLEQVACPGCSSLIHEPFAPIMGMQYHTCSSCSSYFVTPRPTQVQLVDFYKESSACQYWRREMANMQDERLYYIYGPRVAWMIEWADEYLTTSPLLVDMQTKYSFLMKHIKAQHVFGKIYLKDAQLFENETLLAEDFIAGQPLDGQADMVTCFEGFERSADPKRLLEDAFRLCKKGGLFLMTTASCSGLEYQVLKENAPNLNPINRLNLLSLESIVTLFERVGFEVMELSTPGRLDVEIVKNVLEKTDLPHVDPFWKYVFGHRQTRTFHLLQQFLQESRLSSHVRLVAKKNNS